MKKIAASLAALLALSAPAFAAPANDHPTDLPGAKTGTAPDAARGRTIYFAAGCWQCHGTTGTTGGPGPRIAPSALSDDAIRLQLRRPVGVMPFYTSAVISDADMTDLIAYLHTEPAPTRRARDIPMLQDVK